MDVESHKAFEEEVSFTDTIVRLVVLPYNCEKHSNGKFSNGFRRVRGDASDLDVVLLRSTEVDVVKASAS